MVIILFGALELHFVPVDFLSSRFPQDGSDISGIRNLEQQLGGIAGADPDVHLVGSGFTQLDIVRGSGQDADGDKGNQDRQNQYEADHPAA